MIRKIKSLLGPFGLHKDKGHKIGGGSWTDSSERRLLESLIKDNKENRCAWFTTACEKLPNIVEKFGIEVFLCQTDQWNNVEGCEKYQEALEKLVKTMDQEGVSIKLLVEKEKPQEILTLEHLEMAQSVTVSEVPHWSVNQAGTSQRRAS